ncbi:hypothetical protein B0I37DRAFT_401745, partial [Chaetomium sp. MPI-CAGE-AT-0009]
THTKTKRTRFSFLLLPWSSNALRRENVEVPSREVLPDHLVGSWLGDEDPASSRRRRAPDRLHCSISYINVHLSSGDQKLEISQPKINLSAERGLSGWHCITHLLAPPHPILAAGCIGNEGHVIPGTRCPRQAHCRHTPFDGVRRV